MSTNPSLKKKQSLLGEIRANSAYPIEAFKQRTGLGQWALRQMRKNGLKVLRISGRSFIRGSDFLDFLNQQADGDGHQS